MNRYISTSIYSDSIGQAICPGLLAKYSQTVYSYRKSKANKSIQAE